MIDWAFLPSVTVGLVFTECKKLEDYYQILEWNKLPVLEHLLTIEDLIIRKHILNLMYNLKLPEKIKGLF
jgi:hypothetical protein